MNLIINGEKTEVNKNLNINELLYHQKVKMPELVSVELNGQILKRSEFENTLLNEGDKIEFLYFMGGGNVAN
jgi:sulfur carrier protein